jgi:hypothetical protein
MSYSIRLIASMNIDKVRSKQGKLRPTVFIALAKRARATGISSKAIFKLLSFGLIPKTPAFWSHHPVTTHSYSCGLA